jgi:SpoIIAA-like
VPATLKSDGDNRYRVDVGGTLARSELAKVQDAIAGEIAQVGKVRLLFVLDRFKGWEKGADWGDMTFYDQQGMNIERIAIVGEEQWRDDALMFALAGLRKAPTRYFLPSEIDGACVWLAQPSPGL